MNDEMRKTALQYVVNKNGGFYDDLVYEIGDELVDELVSIGFIHVGYTRDRKTWKVTNLAETYKKDLNW